MAESALNPRAALAGVNILKGMSTKQALIAAGYSPMTARKPKAAGLDAERCIAEARKLDPENHPGKLIESARMLLGKRLTAALATPETIAKTPLSHVARLIEVTERWYGDRAPRGGAENAGHVVDALAWVSRIVEQLQAARATPTSSGESLEAARAQTLDIPSNVR